jgi:hypothetical protein
MNKNFYRLVALMMLVTFSIKANHVYGPDDTGRNLQTLEPPYLEPYPFLTFQTQIGLYLGNYDQGAVTELYRSTNSASGFILVQTFSEHAQYADRDLKPRTTYYYRARSARNGQYSDYVYYTATTESKWYQPEFTAVANASGNITLRLTDHSYQEDSYEILRDGEIVPFFIDASDSGRVFAYNDIDVQPNTTYHYVVNATLKDEGTPFLEDVAHATITTGNTGGCGGAGSIEREKWLNVAGRNVQYIPTKQPPDQFTTLTEFRAPTNDGTNYGARIRGYLCPPVTGKYIFFISSDDEGQLFLSTDTSPGNKRKIAYVLDHTDPLDWTRYPSQRSVEIELTQGQLYYIEALHKEASGGDNLAVGWQLPDGTLERPIAGNRLVTYPRDLNYPPQVNIVAPFQNQAYTAPADVAVQVSVYDVESSVARVEIWRDSVKLAEDTEAPFNIYFNDLPQGAYRFEARAYDTDGASASDFVDFSIKAPVCEGTGSIEREFWLNIPGTSLSSVPFNTPPQSYSSYSSFETGQYEGTNYGSRMRGYVCIPQTGNYTFWISSDDNSELWLSTDDTPGNKRLIASVTGATAFRDYTKYPAQKSVAIPMQGGQKYYIEALHKEGTGNDFISVGWQLPDGALERPIPGNRLIRLTAPGTRQEPLVAFIEPEDNERFDAGSNILLRASASDPDGSVYKVSFEANSQVLYEDFTAPYEYTWNNVPAGTYLVMVRATDNEGLSNVEAIDIVVGEQSCAGTGKIYREVWTGIAGTSVSSIPVNTTPNRIVELTSFSTPNYYGNDYGARIRGYLCVPVSGSYIFYIASDDNSELWLSTDEDPSNKVKIAYLNGAVPVNVWDKYATQRSSAIQLVGGQRYYIEALHKEGNGADHISVAWRFQNGDFEGPIPGNRLIPYVDPATSTAVFVDAEVVGEAENMPGVYPNPVKRNSGLTIHSPEGGGDAAVELMSGTGAVVQRTNLMLDDAGEGQMQLNDQIVPGLYILKIFSNRKQRVVKVQVE